jgi:peptidoglycan hydrolase-like protein with peptidoglycan-binding domain
MDRIFFQRASSGFRAVQGELIVRIQRVLSDAGFYHDTIDGIYGGNMERALLEFQQQNNLSATGKIDESTWRLITQSDLPDLTQRMLQVTADFEGTGFTKAVGNFDGAGLTWGIIGFTLSNGELTKLLSEIKARHENVFTDAFGALTDEIVRVMNSSHPEQMLFANSISVGTSKIKILPEWAAAFERLGSNQAVQDIQIEHTQKYFDIAESDAQRLHIQNERGKALCFDIAVQNGGIDAIELGRIRAKMQASPPTTEQDLLIIIANVVAENSAHAFIEDVRKRKLTIATGRGIVHGSQYDLRSWGLDEFSADSNQSTVPVTITNSVGLNGVNNTADVLAIKARFIELGFDFMPPGDQLGPIAIKVIKLFQGIKNGFNTVNDSRNDGRIDPGGDTLKWLQAVNAPRWQRMPVGSRAEGFINDNIVDLTDNHDFGTSWMANTLHDTAAAYMSNFLNTHPQAALLHINDTSLPQGGDTPVHLGHETGIASDIRLPRTDGSVGGITVSDSVYDRAAMRAMIGAFRKQPQASRVFLSDQVLVAEGLCQAAKGHDNHAHFEIKPPARILAS